MTKVLWNMLLSFQNLKLTYLQGFEFFNNFRIILRIVYFHRKLTTKYHFEIAFSAQSSQLHFDLHYAVPMDPINFLGVLEGIYCPICAFASLRCALVLRQNLTLNFIVIVLYCKPTFHGFACLRFDPASQYIHLVPRGPIRNRRACA